MADDGFPDFSPAALSRLVAGMTIEEVEEIVGCLPRRPKRLDRNTHLAWIGVGGMLRAFFKGPGETLSAAVLSVPEVDRPLDLGPDPRRRLRQATIVQTWFCVPCRQRYRQPQSGRAVVCSACGVACEQAVPGVRVPSPRYAKAWDRFWRQYRNELAMLDAYANRQLQEAVRLELLDIDLPKSRRARRST